MTECLQTQLPNRKFPPVAASVYVSVNSIPLQNACQQLFLIGLVDSCTLIYTLVMMITIAAVTSQFYRSPSTFRWPFQRRCDHRMRTMPAVACVQYAKQECSETDVVLSSGFMAFPMHTGFLRGVETAGYTIRGVCGTSSGGIKSVQLSSCFCHVIYCVSGKG